MNSATATRLWEYQAAVAAALKTPMMRMARLRRPSERSLTQQFARITPSTTTRPGKMQYKGDEPFAKSANELATRRYASNMRRLNSVGATAFTHNKIYLSTCR